MFNFFNDRIFSVLLILRILIKSNYFGFYAITIGGQGCLSEPIEFLTEFLPSSLEIIEQPIINYNLKNDTNMSEIRNIYQRSGDFLPRVLFIYLKKRKIN